MSRFRKEKVKGLDQGKNGTFSTFFWELNKIKGWGFARIMVCSNPLLEMDILFFKGVVPRGNRGQKRPLSHSGEMLK